MKKYFTCMAVTMFVVLAPFVLFAKTAVSDEELSAVIAQEGVTIDCGITVDAPVPRLYSFGDSDGFAGYTSPGWIGLRSIFVNMDEISLTDPMTIDIGSSGSVTKLNIGLPVIRYGALVHSATLRLDNTKTLNTVGQPSLGTLYQDKFIFYLNYPGDNASITLSSHETTQGLEIGLSNVILRVPSVAINLSWGDADGFTGYTAAGYFGVKNLLAENTAGDTNVPLLTLNGTMEIDVGTNAGVTGLNVVLPVATVGSINLTAPLVLGTARELLGGTQALGTLYLEGLNPTVSGSLTTLSH